MIRLYLAGAIALAVAGVGLWFYNTGAKVERGETLDRQIQANEQTQKAIDNADRSSGDVEEDYDWLCLRFGIECGELPARPADGRAAGD